MKRQHGYIDALDVTLFLIVPIIFCLLIGGAMLASHYACHAKWGRSGMSAIEWGPIQGCLVKLPDGRWMPEERIREIDIPRPKQ